MVVLCGGAGTTDTAAFDWTDMDRKCSNCAKWEPYPRKRDRLWYGHCAARKADTYSEASCHKFKDMFKPNK